MINHLPKYMLISLICTILIEVIVSIILKVKNKKDILNIVLVNILTNPIVVAISFIINIYIGIKIRNISLIFIEILVVIIEGRIYKKHLEFKNINPYMLSLILNIASYGGGLIINKLI